MVVRCSGELYVYRAKDRRVYDGALCSDMQRELDHTNYLERRMKRADGTARCTYYPAESRYLVFTDVAGRPKILTGNMHSFKQLALIEAIQVLEGSECAVSV